MEAIEMKPLITGSWVLRGRKVIHAPTPHRLKTITPRVGLGRPGVALIVNRRAGPVANHQTWPTPDGCRKLFVGKRVHGGTER